MAYQYLYQGAEIQITDMEGRGVWRGTIDPCRLPRLVDEIKKIINPHSLPDNLCGEAPEFYTLWELNAACEILLENNDSDVENVAKTYVALRYAAEDIARAITLERPEIVLPITVQQYNRPRYIQINRINLPVGTALALKGYAGCQYVVPCQVSQQQRQPTSESMLTILLHDNDNDFPRLCAQMAKRLNLDHQLITVSSVGQVNNQTSPAVLCCVCTLYDNYRVCGEILQKLRITPDVALLFVPSVARPARISDELYPLGYAQRFVVENGVPWCFAFSGHPTCEGSRQLFQRIIQTLPARGANIRTLMDTVSNVIHAPGDRIRLHTISDMERQVVAVSTKIAEMTAKILVCGQQ